MGLKLRLRVVRLPMYVVLLQGSYDIFPQVFSSPHIWFLIPCVAMILSYAGSVYVPCLCQEPTLGTMQS